MSEFEKELLNKVSPHDRTHNGHELFLGGFLAEHFKDWQPQQAIPVVPEHVGDYISELKEKGHGIQFGLMCSTHNVAGEGNEKAIHWKDDNAEDFARAWIDGYTVEKPQLFYLKNKIKLEDVGSDLIGYLNLFLTNDGYLTSNINRAKKITQEEIDSMQTGNYEKIEVEL
jgi:hypothetical protein